MSQAKGQVLQDECAYKCPCWRCTKRAECDIIDKCSDYSPALQGVRL